MEERRERFLISFSFFLSFLILFVTESTGGKVSENSMAPILKKSSERQKEEEENDQQRSSLWRAFINFKFA